MDRFCEEQTKWLMALQIIMISRLKIKLLIVIAILAINSLIKSFTKAITHSCLLQISYNESI